MSERSDSLGGVLTGTRVLDFGRYIAGPYCAALLADLGADVIRIERIGGGEDRWVAPVGDDGVGAMFLVMNRNKRAMTLDPSSPDGRDDRPQAGGDRGRRRRQPPARSAPIAVAGSRQPAADQARHHPHHGHRVRRRRPVEPQARVRRHRSGHGRRRLSHRDAGAAHAGLGGLGRFRHRVGLRLRHPGGADGAPEDGTRSEGRGGAAAHRRGLQQSDAGRATDRATQPHRDAEPRRRLRRPPICSARGTAGSSPMPSADPCSSAGPS